MVLIQCRCICACKKHYERIILLLSCVAVVCVFWWALHSQFIIHVWAIHDRRRPNFTGRPGIIVGSLFVTFYVHPFASWTLCRQDKTRDSDNPCAVFLRACGAHTVLLCCVLRILQPGSVCAGYLWNWIVVYNCDPKSTSDIVSQGMCISLLANSIALKLTIEIMFPIQEHISFTTGVYIAIANIAKLLGKLTIGPAVVSIGFVFIKCPQLGRIIFHVDILLVCDGRIRCTRTSKH